MDRLTASSTAPSPDWSIASLVNVPHENKRHCRIFDASTVSLNLAQMTEAAEREAQEERDGQEVELTEAEAERMRVQQRMQEKIDEEEQANESSSFDEMIKSVDALLSSTSLAEVIPPTTPSPATSPYTSPPPPETTTSADFSARETTTAAPSGLNPATADPHTTTTPTTAPLPPITPTTALHSHPPSSTERTFAHDLRAAHHARLTAAEPTQEKRRIPTPANALAAFDAVTQYGGLIPHTNKKKKKLTFAKAVVRGFRGVFGEERRW